MVNSRSRDLKYDEKSYQMTNRSRRSVLEQ
jgi:hypothetical protein